MGSVGRTYPEVSKHEKSVHVGLKTEDFSFDSLQGRLIMRVRCIILKKWRKKGEVKADLSRYEDVVIHLSDEPFVSPILEWLARQKEIGEERYMPITRTRAYQIPKQIDPRIVGSHWLRHQRLSHLAEHLNPYQLNERIGFWESLDPATACIHGRMSAYLGAVEVMLEKEVNLS